MAKSTGDTPLLHLEATHRAGCSWKRNGEFSEPFIAVHAPLGDSGARRAIAIPGKGQRAVHDNEVGIDGEARRVYTAFAGKRFLLDTPFEDNTLRFDLHAEPVLGGLRDRRGRGKTLHRFFVSY